MPSGEFRDRIQQVLRRLQLGEAERLHRQMRQRALTASSSFCCWRECTISSATTVAAYSAEDDVVLLNGRCERAKQKCALPLAGADNGRDHEVLRRNESFSSGENT